MWIVRSPDHGERVDRGRVDDGDSADAPGGPREELYPEFPLQGGYPFRGGLLGGSQMAGGCLELASLAYLGTIVPDDGLLVATSRFESTTWSATIIEPPVGGAAIGLLGPGTTVVVDAVSYLLSALGIAAIREPEPPRTLSVARASGAASS